MVGNRTCELKKLWYTEDCRVPGTGERWRYKCPKSFMGCGAMYMIDDPKRYLYPHFMTCEHISHEERERILGRLSQRARELVTSSVNECVSSPTTPALTIHTPPTKRFRESEDTPTGNSAVAVFNSETHQWEEAQPRGVETEKPHVLEVVLGFLSEMLRRVVRNDPCLVSAILHSSKGDSECKRLALDYVWMTYTARVLRDLPMTPEVSILMGTLERLEMAPHSRIASERKRLLHALGSCVGGNCGMRQFVCDEGMVQCDSFFRLEEMDTDTTIRFLCPGLHDSFPQNVGKQLCEETPVFGLVPETTEVTRAVASSFPLAFVLEGPLETAYLFFTAVFRKPDGHPAWLVHHGSGKFVLHDRHNSQPLSETAAVMTHPALSNLTPEVFLYLASRFVS